MVGPVGRHALAELAVTNARVLDDAVRLRDALVEAVTTAGATVRQVMVETFQPHGVTVLALLSESHASLHTWPERRRAYVDVFTCGTAADPERAVDELARALDATITDRQVVSRGGERSTVDEPIAPGLVRRWELGAVHLDQRTPFQHLLIAETAHGTTLFSDNERQSAEATQLIYHEALFVPAALLAARRERVLVIGSGEGVVSEMAVAAGAELVDHVDIDRDCVRACAEYLPYGYTPSTLAAAERAEGPVRVHYTDGVAFVADRLRHRRDEDGYDIVVVDLPDERPTEPGAGHNRLYTAEFLTRCRKLLRDGGVVVSQAGSPARWRDATLRAALDRFQQVFAQVVPYVCAEHEWAFLIGRQVDATDPVAEMEQRLADLPYRPVTIDAAALRAGAVLPRGVRDPIGSR